jgi:glucose/arabinose dehydrogenase
MLHILYRNLSVQVTAILCGLCSILLLAACDTLATSPNNGAFQATLPPTLASAPVYTATPTPTASLTPTITPSPTLTPTLTLTPTATLTLTLTPTPTLTPSPTFTPSPVPTQPLFTLTPISQIGMPPAVTPLAAVLAPTAGWSCEDFPCEGDVDGFMQRIQVPAGYALERAGKFPGQPMQITVGPDGRLYATVLEGGTRNGAVYALNADGSAQRYSGDLISPVGLAFQPGTDVLYVTARTMLTQGGALYRIPSGGGLPEPILTDLPCCLSIIDNQPNGLTFGPDGYLYMAIGALTDHAESPRPKNQPFADILPNEAAVLRIQPHTGAVEVFASGLRNPYDLAFDAFGVLYATDNGIIAGPGDRVLALSKGAFYGWPYWRERGCEACPPTKASVTIAPDLLALPDLTLPRGLVAYTGTQFPADAANNLFVALWNGTPDGQRVVRINPRDPLLGQEGYTPQPFVTGLIRPVDVALSPDGSLLVADFIYGYVWRVRYTG